MPLTVCFNHPRSPLAAPRCAFKAITILSVKNLPCTSSLNFAPLTSKLCPLNPLLPKPPCPSGKGSTRTAHNTPNEAKATSYKPASCHPDSQTQCPDLLKASILYAFFTTISTCSALSRNDGLGPQHPSVHQY